MKIELTEHAEVELTPKPVKFELWKIEPVKNWLMCCEKEDSHAKTKSDCKQFRKSYFNTARKPKY